MILSRGGEQAAQTCSELFHIFSAAYAMKKFFYLVNFEFRRIFMPLLGISLFLIVFQQILLGAASKSQRDYIPYEEFFASSGAVIVFYIAFAGVCGLCIMSLISNYFRSKSIYTLMTLPRGRVSMYFSKLISGFTAFLVILSTQLASVMLGYILFAPKIVRYIEDPGTSNVTVYNEHAKNGLMLAFVRSDFLRIIFPLGIESLISTLFIFIAFLCGLYYAVICERSRKYKGILAFLIQIGIAIYTINYRINAVGTQKVSFHSLTLDNAAMFILAVIFIWDSLRKINKSTICETV